MIAKSFSEKGDFETQAGVTFQDVEFTFIHMWDSLLSQNLRYVLINGYFSEGSNCFISHSFVVTDDDSGKILAVSMNDDLHEMPPLVFNSRPLKHIFDFLGECEDACR